MDELEDIGVSKKWFQGLIRGYGNKTTYEKLNGLSGRRRRRRLATVELGSNTRRRFWRIKISPKFRFFRKYFPSPKKLLIRLRDAYVDMMLGIANSRVFSGGGGAVCGGVSGFGQRPAKEYDEKIILEIYKSMVAAHRQMVHRPAAAAGLELKHTPSR